MDLNSNLLLPEGSRISVVILELVPDDNGVRYALVNNSGLSEEGMKAEQDRYGQPVFSAIGYNS